MKIVSFETAKALKEAGYPQENNRICYSEIGDLIIISGNTNLDFSTDFLAAPTYLEVWGWLWREKEIRIELNSGAIVSMRVTDFSWSVVYQNNYSDPEKAIIAAIDYLVENNLIK